MPSRRDRDRRRRAPSARGRPRERAPTEARARATAERNAGDRETVLAIVATFAAARSGAREERARNPRAPADPSGQT